MSQTPFNKREVLLVIIFKKKMKNLLFMTKTQIVPFFIIILPTHIYIHSVKVFGSKNYSQSYKIVCLRQYPTKVNYTKKEKGIKYKIPDNYQVKTMLGGLIVLCKTQYQFSRKIAVKYTVKWIDENGQVNSRYSLSSAGA